MLKNSGVKPWLIVMLVCVVIVALTFGGLTVKRMLNTGSEDPVKVAGAASSSAAPSRHAPGRSVCGGDAKPWVALTEFKDFADTAYWVAAPTGGWLATIDGYGPCKATDKGVPYGYSHTPAGAALWGINFVQLIPQNTFGAAAEYFGSHISDGETDDKTNRDDGAEISAVFAEGNADLIPYSVRVVETAENAPVKVFVVSNLIMNGIENHIVLRFELEWVNGDWWPTRPFDAITYQELLSEADYSALDYVDISRLGMKHDQDS